MTGRLALTRGASARLPPMIESASNLIVTDESFIETNLEEKSESFTDHR